MRFAQTITVWGKNLCYRRTKTCNMSSSSFVSITLTFPFFPTLSISVIPSCKLPQMQKREGRCKAKHTLWRRVKQHRTLIVTQTAQFPPTQRGTRPPTEGSELPSLGLALPPSICHNTWARGGGERGDTTEEVFFLFFKQMLSHRVWTI